MLAYPLATKGGYAGAVGAEIVFTLSVLLLVYLLGSGVLGFLVDARHSCLPGSQRLGRRAYLLVSVSLLPILAMNIAALAGNPVWPAWVPPILLLAIALAGGLASHRRTLAVGLFLLTVLAGCWAATARGAYLHGKEWFFALLAAALVLLPAAATLLAAVDWRGVIRRGSQTRALEDAPWMASVRIGSWGRQSPVQIVRTCLGGTFVQLSRQLLMGATLLAIFIVVAIVLPWLDGSGSGRRWAVTILALPAGGLVAAEFLARLPNLTRGQIAELALMPGLGTPAEQRRALCRAVLTPPLMWLGVVLLFGSADLLLDGEPTSSVSMLAASLVSLWLTYAIFALQKLATLPPKRQSFASELLLLNLVTYSSGLYYWLYAAQLQFRLLPWFWITPVLFGIGIASAIGLSVRRLATAPHPFLS